MRKMQSITNATCFFFILTIFGTVSILAEPDPMARPTRPKVFTSPEELRRYLDLVKDYYSLSGKARYGKRSDATASIPDSDHPWDALRLVLDARRQILQQQRQESSKADKEQLLQIFQNADDRKHASRVVASPYFSYVAGKYYDDAQ